MITVSDSEHGDIHDDLVDDRAIEDASLDHFGHAEFASQAARTIMAIRTPANIAIYAPWGSGKTSLSHLLRKELPRETCGFVHFDAFKYAEAPLRREFIRRVAKGLHVPDGKYDRGLYEEETRSGINLERQSVTALLRTIGIIAGVALSVAAPLSLLLAKLSGKALGPEWVADVRVLIPSIFSPVVIVAPLLALAAAQLNIGRKRYAPQSDEEFERLFRELIDRGCARNPGWNRVVIFIDELDRCAADEVASTLETLRTFLEVDRCVFVVAADRAVLETAVAKKSRQETPYNSQNPYYSIGSAYLDKIFQYQWQLPPMMPSNLSRFAGALVSDRKGGLWSQVDVGEVVSVLVPLHVQSPRRVKELLNAYAMAYRIAERRIADRHIEGDLRERSAELAKLVCLQMEFPGFAGDLPNEPRLPHFVLALADDPDMQVPSDVSNDVWDRAQGYAKSNLQLDVVLARDLDAAGLEGTVGEAGKPARGIIAAQGHLLLRYLQKTRRIPGPGADLVFMEGPGFAFGLPTSLATRLKAAATEGDIDRVTSALVTLSSEQKLAALQLLALHVKEALPGVEGANALSTMLRAVGAVSDVDVSEVADELADAATIGIGEGNLPPEDTVGAIRLGLSTRRQLGGELLSNALAQEATLADEGIAGFVAANAEAFPSQHRARIGEVVASLLVHLSWETRKDAVLSWSDETAVEVFRNARGPLLGRLAAAKEQEGAKQAPTAQVAPSTATSVVATDVEDQSAEEYALEQLSELCAAARDGQRKVVLEAVLELTLSIDAQEARTAVVGMLPPLGQVASPTLSDALLVACARRVVSEKAKWLDALDEAVVAALPNVKGRLESIATSVWGSAEAKDEAKVPVVTQVLASASRLVKHIQWFPAAALVEAVLAEAPVASVDPTGVRAWTMSVRRASIFEEMGLLHPEEWQPTYLDTAVTLATSDVADGATRELVSTVLLEDSKRVVKAVAGDAAKRLSEALATAPTLTATERALARARVAAGVSPDEPSTLGPSAEDLVHAYDEDTDGESHEALAQAIGLWLTTCAPTVEQVWRVVDRYADERLPGAVQSGLSTYADGLTPESRVAFAEAAVAEFPNRIVGNELLEAIQFHACDLPKGVELVIELSKRATNEQHRRGVMRTWTALHLTDRLLIRRLLDEVMLPLVRQGKTSRELVLQNLDLVQALSTSDKRRLAEAIEGAVGEDTEEWDAAAKRLVEAGFMRRRFFGRRPEHLD